MTNKQLVVLEVETFDGIAPEDWNWNMLSNILDISVRVDLTRTADVRARAKLKPTQTEPKKLPKHDDFRPTDKFPDVSYVRYMKALADGAVK